MNNELRVAVLKAMGWRFWGESLESDDGDHWWSCFGPNGERREVASFAENENELLHCAGNDILFPDPTTNKAEALELLESVGLPWNIGLDGEGGNALISNMTDDGHLMWSDTQQEILVDGPFCEASCRAFLRWKEIKSE